MFSNCSNYAPVVKEEEPAGTVVIQVNAEDRDPLEEGGIVATSNIYAIHKTSLQIIHAVKEKLYTRKLFLRFSWFYNILDRNMYGKV